MLYALDVKTSYSMLSSLIKINDLTEKAKELGYDAVHDTVHEMAKDEARHGRGFKGLYDRYFKK